MPKLRLPDDFDEKSERALKQLKKFAASCFWCGYGYKEYSSELEDEHFAYHCPDAPEELKENARKRLRDSDASAQEKTASKQVTSKRKCRRRRS